MSRIYDYNFYPPIGKLVSIENEMKNACKSETNRNFNPYRIICDSYIYYIQL